MKNQCILHSEQMMHTEVTAGSVYIFDGVGGIQYF